MQENISTQEISTLNYLPLLDLLLTLVAKPYHLLVDKLRHTYLTHHNRLIVVCHMSVVKEPISISMFAVKCTTLTAFQHTCTVYKLSMV